jgi:hypothetical protein
MSSDTNRHRRPPSRRNGLGTRGSTSMETALVFIPFMFIMIATTDLGRWFLTQHSLRTLSAEAARATMVACYAAGTCSLSSTAKAQVQALTPFLASGSTTLNASQTVVGGVRTITVTATYPFNFIFAPWTDLSGTITETTNLSY